MRRGRAPQLSEERERLRAVVRSTAIAEQNNLYYALLNRFLIKIIEININIAPIPPNSIACQN